MYQHNIMSILKSYKL